LNDIIPELYQMAYDKYNQEGQDLYNQYGMLSDDRNVEYGMWGDKRNALVVDRDYYGNEANNQWNKDYGVWSDKRNQLVADRDYYANESNNAYAKDYGEWSDNRTYDQNQYWSETEFGYGQERDSIADEQWRKSFEEGVRQFNANLAETQRQHNENMALSREKITTSGGKKEEEDPEEPEYTYEETEATSMFKASIRTRSEFGRGGNPDKAKYGTYQKYIEGMIDKWLSSGKLTENEAATLIAHYGL
jgi:hypothetical protein